MPLDQPDTRDAVDPPEALPRMTFGDHLDELRKRVIKALLAVVVAVIGVLPFKNAVQEIIVGPYRTQWQIGFEGWIAKLQAQQDAGVISEDSAEFLQFCVARKEEMLDAHARSLRELRATMSTEREERRHLEEQLSHMRAQLRAHPSTAD